MFMMNTFNPSFSYIVPAQPQNTYCHKNMDDTYCVISCDYTNNLILFDWATDIFIIATDPMPRGNFPVPKLVWRCSTWLFAVNGYLSCASLPECLCRGWDSSSNSSVCRPAKKPFRIERILVSFPTSEDEESGVGLESAQTSLTNNTESCWRGSITELSVLPIFAWKITKSHSYCLFFSRFNSTKRHSLGISGFVKMSVKTISFNEEVLIPLPK